MRQRATTSYFIDLELLQIMCVGYPRRYIGRVQQGTPAYETAKIRDM